MSFAQLLQTANQRRDLQGLKSEVELWIIHAHESI